MSTPVPSTTDLTTRLDRNAPAVEVENGFDPPVLAAARSMGYAPEPPGFEYARIYMVVRRDGEWIGVADPRHDGQVRGY